MRSSSNSAPRQNLPYQQTGNYPHQQQYYSGNLPYSGQSNNPKMGGHDNRPYQKNYQMNQPYSAQRMHYPTNMQHTGTYNPQNQGMTQNYPGNYPQGNMIGNDQRGGYQNITPRPYNNNSQYTPYNYQNQPVQSLRYPSTYQNQNSTYLIDE